MPKQKLIIDTDGVADDVRAVSLAIQHPNAELLAITCVAGCTTVEQASANMARTLRANDRKNIPIYRGAEGPLIGSVSSQCRETQFFGLDGIGDAPHDFPEVLSTDFHAHVSGKHAAVALVELLETHPPGTITLVCIGPLTNMALALRLCPRLAGLPKEVVVMGGNVFATGNLNSISTAECNFGSDPEAAHILFEEMRCPVTVVPWEAFLAESAREAGVVDFHAHLSIDAPLARYFTTVTRHGMRLLAESGHHYAYCDEIAVAVALERERVVKEVKHLRASVELQGQFTRGQVAIDWVEQFWEKDARSERVCRRRNPITFVTAYSANYVDQLVRYAIENHCAAFNSQSAQGISPSSETTKEVAMKESGLFTPLPSASDVNGALKYP